MIATSFRRLLPPALALAIGLLTALPPLVISGFEETPGGRDTQLVNYALEHSYRFLQQHPLHHDFWDPPIFYPARNVAAYTDTLLSLAPFYWPWRTLGLAPDSAFQVWLVIMWALNFLAFYLYLRRIFGLGETGAAAGAFLFAFGSSRAANVLHPQLIPAFFLVAALYALHRAFDSELPRRWRQGWILAFFLALTAQAWGAVYPAFFFALLTGLALLAALTSRPARARFGSFLRDGAPALVAGALVAAVLTAPLAARYRVTAETHGVRTWEDVEPFQPRWVSWMLMGTTHRLWGWLYDTELTAEGRFLRTANHANGLGLIALAVAGIGLYRHRRLPAVRLMVMASLLAILLTTVFPGGFTFWRLVYENLPGAAAIRAVGRIGLLLLIPAGLGVGWFFESRRGPWWQTAAILLLLIVEQAHAPAAYDKLEARRRAQAIAEAVGADCRSFFVTTTATHPGIHEDAMWAGILAGVPTVNGRYGNFPPGWTLYDKAYRRRGDASQDGADAALGAWLEHNCLAAEDVCRIDSPVPGEAVGRQQIADVKAASPSCAGSRGLAR